MPGPLIPYLNVQPLKLGFLEYLPLLGRYVDPSDPPSIKPFGALVALGVYIGSVVALRHARSRGLDLKKMNEFIFWMLVGGFVGAHMLDAIFYHPARVASNPLYLFALWDGLSSYGGFIGAVLGGLAWRARRRERLMPYVEPMLSAFPLAWVFGRSGCAVVHDHPGQFSDAWFAVQYPLANGGFVGRYDLGLYEMVLTIPLAVTFLLLWRRKTFRPLGFYTGWICIAYAPVRFLLDFLRAPEGGIVGGDPRYAGLTPAQWASIALVGVGLHFLRMARSDAGNPRAVEPPPAADEDEEDEGSDEEGAHVPDASAR